MDRDTNTVSLGTLSSRISVWFTFYCVSVELSWRRPVLVKTQRHSSSHHHVYQRLTFELQAEIFVQCMPMTSWVEFRDINMHPHHIRARLALICRAWYTVLYNEPRVWTTAVLPGRFQLARAELLSLWFEKSKVHAIGCIYSDTVFASSRRTQTRDTNEHRH